jgi:hypothetical protein
MSLAGSSETISTGGIIATNIVGGKEHQVSMIAGADGHIVGSRPDFMLYFTPAANAANRIVGDIYNTGTVPIRIRGVWMIPTMTAVTGAQLGWTFDRTNAIGTGGTSITPVPMDTTAGTWPAAATARTSPTAGATTAAKYLEQYTLNEETSAAFGILPLINMLPQLGDRVCEIVLNQNQGLAVKQIVTNTVGLTGMLMLATYDN